MKVMGLARACVGALLLALVCAQSATAEVVTLQALEQRALQNRPALAAGSARTRAARAQIEQAESAYYPTLSLQAQSGVGPGRDLFPIDVSCDPEDLDCVRTGDDIVLIPGAREINDSSAFLPSVRSELDLELKSSLYDFGRTRAAVEAGRAQHASAQAEEDAARHAIVLAVRGAYLAWLGQSELLAIAESAATDAERRSQRVQSLIEEGARPKAELSIARAEEMLAKLELQRARGALAAARLGVEHAVGSRLGAAAEPDRALLQSSAEAPHAGDDAALRALALRLRAASADARRLERADAPLLAGALSAGVRAQDEHVFPAYAVGLSFSLPLLDGGGADAAADAARARAGAIAAELQAERERRRNDRDRAELDRDNARAQLETASALLEVVTQRVSEAEQSYELGATGLEPVAQARALLRRAQTEVVHARLAQAEAALRLSPR
jgi:outer membrane protein TolC